MSDASSTTLHACAVLLGERGALVRGPAGAGKTSLALGLAAAARARGGLGLLVADDRVRLVARGGRLVARPHPALAGLAEVRGAGPVRLPAAGACVVEGVIDLDPAAPRVGDADKVVLLGVLLPRLVLPLRTLPEGAYVAWLARVAAPARHEAPGPA